MKSFDTSPEAWRFALEASDALRRNHLHRRYAVVVRKQAINRRWTWSVYAVPK